MGRAGNGGPAIRKHLRSFLLPRPRCCLPLRQTSGGISPKTEAPPSTLSSVVLEEIGGDRKLPIWIGPFEATSIAIRLDGAEVPRPDTSSFVTSMGAHEISPDTITKFRQVVSG